MPFPFECPGSNPYILMAYEFASATRTIRMDWKGEAPTPSWMGWSRVTGKAIASGGCDRIPRGTVPSTGDSAEIGRGRPVSSRNPVHIPPLASRLPSGPADQPIQDGVGASPFQSIEMVRVALANSYAIKYTVGPLENFKGKGCTSLAGTPGYNT